MSADHDNDEDLDQSLEHAFDYNVQNQAKHVQDRNQNVSVESKSKIVQRAGFKPITQSQTFDDQESVSPAAPPKVKYVMGTDGKLKKKVKRKPTLISTTSTAVNPQSTKLNISPQQGIGNSSLGRPRVESMTSDKLQQTPQLGSNVHIDSKDYKQVGQESDRPVNQRESPEVVGSFEPEAREGSSCSKQTLNETAIPINQPGYRGAVASFEPKVLEDSFYSKQALKEIANPPSQPGYRGKLDPFESSPHESQDSENVVSSINVHPMERENQSDDSDIFSDAASDKDEASILSASKSDSETKEVSDVDYFKAVGKARNIIQPLLKYSTPVPALQAVSPSHEDHEKHAEAIKRLSSMANDGYDIDTYFGGEGHWDDEEEDQPVKKKK